jgi:hypothetical protein
MPRNLKRLAVGISAWLLTCGAALGGAAEDGLKPFSASYSISWHGIAAGSAQLQLQLQSDGRWSYRMQTFARGLARLAMPAQMDSRSVFRIQDDRVVPETFTVDDGTDDDDNDQSVVFDWEAGRVRGIAERKRVDLQLQPGLLDTLSVQVALMRELLAGRTPERFVLLDAERIKDYIYTTQGREKLQTDAGTYDTVIFRSTRPGSRKSTWFWCAPELGYLPLKVERRDGTDVQLSMRVRSAQR